MTLKIKINWSLYQGCTFRPTEDEQECPIHPLVTYANEDGLCSHPACEGDHSKGDCGRIVAIDYREVR